MKCHQFLTIVILALSNLVLSQSLHFFTNSEQIDVRNHIDKGLITASANTEFDIGSIENFFDGDVATLARTPGINPLIITLQFESEFQIDSSRIYISSHDGLWTIEAAKNEEDLDNKSNSYKIAVDNRSMKMDVWDGVGFSVSGRILRLTVHRTTGDDYVHLHEWELFGEVNPPQILSFRVNFDSLQLYKNWRWMHNKYFATLFDGSEKEIPLGDVELGCSDSSVISVDSAGTLFTQKAGSANLTANYSGMQAQQHIKVFEPVFPPVFEEIDPYLSTPAHGFIYEIPVVVFRFLPTKDGINLDVSYAPGHHSLDEIRLTEMKNWINVRDRRSKFGLEERTRYHGYRDSSAVPSLGYRIVEYITIYTQAPPGNSYGTDNGELLYWPDYHLLFEQYDMQRYVDDLGVKEIWFWINQLVPGMPSYDPAIHRPENYRAIWESNMSSPTTDDISNSGHDPDDLPIYNSTYVVMDRNMRRSQPELHSAGHQLEVMLDYINRRQDGDLDLFRRKFVGCDENYNFILGRCGWTHNPPNTLNPYDYHNSTLVESDIEDWTPDGNGATRLINVDTWASLNYTWPDSDEVFHDRTELQWYVYWTQNMPGYGNKIEHKDQIMNNWWFFLGEWDLAFRENVGLYGPPVESVSFFSDSSLFNGDLVPVGSIIDIYDNDNVLCSKDTVDSVGAWGPILIFLDDFKTPGKDEGPEQGERLEFMIDGFLAKTLGPNPPVWTTDGALIELNLAARENWDPEIVNLPHSLVFRTDSTVVLQLWDYFDDFETPDSLLNFAVSCNEPRLVLDFENATGLLQILATNLIESTPLFITVTDEAGAMVQDSIKITAIRLSNVSNQDLEDAETLQLFQNYPNPVSNYTKVEFYLPIQSHVKITVYNTLGQEVAVVLDKEMNKAQHSIMINTMKWPAGVYFYKIQAEGGKMYRKFFLLH
ncbi:MAG: T9SS C-terminal target domain-containing protein [Calditrichaeota bacterium]|nr:MAG: T9SS C-terminal target domain-containing protein [Calditrichota bacterium]